MSIFTFTFVILHLAFCCFTVKGTDVTLACPQQQWRNKCKVSISCTLQTVRFKPAVCSVVFNKTAEFKLQRHGSTVASTTCAVDFSTSCDGTFNNHGCSCSSPDGSVYIFKHEMITDDKIHVNGSWFCEPKCVDGTLFPALTTSRGDTCSFIQITYFILECRGIVLLSVGAALVMTGIIMILAAGHGIAGYIGIAVGGVGYILLIAGSALMNVAYIDDEPAGIALLWVGSVLLIVLGIGISISGPCLHRDFSVRAKVGTGLMWVGGTLAIIGGIVATTERCPSDEFPTTPQEILGLVLAVIGFVVFVVGIIIGIVALQED